MGWDWMGVSPVGTGWGYYLPSAETGLDYPLAGTVWGYPQLGLVGVPPPGWDWMGYPFGWDWMGVPPPLSREQLDLDRLCHGRYAFCVSGFVVFFFVFLLFFF